MIEMVSQTAIWFHGGLPPLPIRWVLIRDPQGKFKTQALLCTDVKQDPVQIIKWFDLRWQMVVTCHEVREHLGVETQRQWSDLASLCTTPALRGLFSPGHHAGASARAPSEGAHPPVDLVPQDPADLQRCPGAGAPANLATRCFSRPDAHADNPKLAARLQNGLRSGLCYRP
jgi:hypothetical protein